MRRRISRAQQTKNWCVGFSFPPPAYAGIHPTLYLFGFRANALNSHSPPYLPALIRGLVASASNLGVAVGTWGLRGPRGPPGASEGLRGPCGASRLVCGPDVGFGSGFRVFLGLQTQKYQHFQVTWGGLARFRVTNNLVSHSTGERSPRRGSCRCRV